MDNAREVTQAGQEDVDQQINAATTLEENTERREDDGKNDLANVTSSESHCDGLLRGRFVIGFDVESPLDVDDTAVDVVLASLFVLTAKNMKPKIR